jgi:hypothetical protein
LQLTRVISGIILAGLLLLLLLLLCDNIELSKVIEQYSFVELNKDTVLADKSLTKDEKIEAIRKLNIYYDEDKIRYNDGIKRVCENCNQECLATLYCEHCVRNHLKAKFSSWTSGNDDIDNLIQKCQMETQGPGYIIEWIPYHSNLQNVKYLTKGGCSEIYTADWIGGCYWEWDSRKQQLIRFGKQEVILKRLENVESASQSWFEEVCNLRIFDNLNSLFRE